MYQHVVFLGKDCDTLCDSSSHRFITNQRNDQGPVVRRLICTNQYIKFNPRFLFPLFKSLCGIILPILCGEFIPQIINKKNSTEFPFKAFRSETNFTLTLGHFNPALNDSVLVPVGLFLASHFSTFQREWVSIECESELYHNSIEYEVTKFITAWMIKCCVMHLCPNLSFSHIQQTPPHFRIWKSRISQY